MSRLSFSARLFAGLALSGGAIGYAATLGTAETAPPITPAQAKPAPASPPTIGPATRPADRTLTVAPRASLAAALLGAGVAGLDASLAEQASGQPAGRALVWLGERVGSRARSLKRLEVHTAPGRRTVLVREGEGFVRHELAEQVDETPVRLRLSGAEIVAGLVGAGLPRSLRHTVLDRVAGQQVALLDLIVEHAGASSVSEAGYGRPLYLGLHLADGRILRWIGHGGGLREMGQSDLPVGLLRPTPGPVTSNPGLRFHPVLRFLRWHRGTDFAAPHGTPVQAALAGRVIEAGWQGGYGQTVRLVHADGSATLYAHLSAIDVRPGAVVAQGEVVGRVGSTGLATGPHLHFEWRRGGETLVPSFASPAETANGTLNERTALRQLLSAPYRLPPGHGV